MSAVDLVHRQLEFFKYVPGCRPGKRGPEPTGQGIELDIVLLPDLLLDFRDYNVQHFNPHIKTCTVGGRAARMACVLLHLISDDDGTLNVHLLTRTGNLGRLLVENEFYSTGTKRVWAQCLESVSVGNSEPRCAVWYEQASPPQPQRVLKGRELSAALCRKLGHQTILRHARTVCLTAVKTPDFQQLLKLVADNLAAAQAGLFLDTSRAASLQDLAEKLLGAVDGLGEEKKLRICGLFLSSETSQRLGLEEAAALLAWSKKKELPVIQYGVGDEIRYAFPGANAVVAVPDKAVPFGTEDVSERFKAGVLLASTVHRTVAAIEQQATDKRAPLVATPPFDCANVWRRLKSEWQPNEWIHILAYGRDLAAVQTSQAFCSFEDLVGSMPPGGNSDHFPSCSGLLARIEPTWAQNPPWFSLKGDEGRSLSLLAGQRRKGTLKQPDLARCGEPQCHHPCRRSPKLRAAAVLIDLDGTLMDSTEQRTRGLLAALPHIDPSRSSQDSVNFFEKEVYGRWAIFKDFGCGDYRQEWNHPGWYITYLVLRQDLPSLSNLDASPKNCRDEFMKAYDRVAEKHRHGIQSARRAFSGETLVPFKEARDFLESLRASQAVHLYICSEGVPDVQWEKIQRAGLDAFFPREHVLTTGEATEMAEERRLLSAETSRLEERLAHTNEENDRLRDRLHQISAIIDEVRIVLGTTLQMERISRSVEPERGRIMDLIRADRESVDLLEKQLQTAGFVNAVLGRLADKTGLSFYAAVIRSILRNQRSPVEELRSIRRLRSVQRKFRPIKFAMIGDRHTKDIRPPLTLLGRERLLTIRIASGRYANAPEEPLEGNDKSDAPTFIVYTLAQAKALLLTKSVWEKVKCADDPPIFGWRILVRKKEVDQPPDKLTEDESTVGLNFVLRGVEMSRDEFSTISGICAGVLTEYLLRCDGAGRNAILSIYLDAESRKLPAERVRALWSLLCETLPRERHLWEPYGEDVCRRVSADVHGLLAASGADRDAKTGCELLDLMALIGPQRSRKIARDLRQEIRRLYGA
jgi:beta-phosphoglucomutase-like phosphatase (HAD superfamily)